MVFFVSNAINIQQQEMLQTVATGIESRVAGKFADS